MLWGNPARILKSVTHFPLVSFQLTNLKLLAEAIIAWFWFLRRQVKFHIDDNWVLLPEEGLGKASCTKVGETLNEQKNILFQRARPASWVGFASLSIIH